MKSKRVERFWYVFKEYKKLVLWSFSSSVLPIAAYFFSISPPWPNGVIVITTIIEIIAILIGFQLLSSSNKRTINITILISGILSIIFFLSYLTAFSILTHNLPKNTGSIIESRITKGLKCKERVEKLFIDECPMLEKEHISQFENDPKNIWTSTSLTASRMILLFLWFGVFFSLSFMIASFLSYLSRY